MAWIEYHTALRDHWKIKRLATILEVDYLHALGAVSCLWLWVAEYAPDGDINRFSDVEICDAARCNLKKFSKEALKKCELINDKGKINDWNKHGLKLLESNRKRVKECRLRKRYSNVTVMPTNQPNQPTLPNQPNQYKYLGDLNFQKVFNDYLEMRKKIRKPATDRAKDIVLKKLHEYDLDTAVKMLEQSIVGSWQSVYELKTKEQKAFSNNQGDSDLLIKAKSELGQMAKTEDIVKWLKVLPVQQHNQLRMFLLCRYPKDGDQAWGKAEVIFKRG